MANLSLPSTRRGSRTVIESALSPVLAKLRSEPSRTWSIIVSFYGDAVLPRGGSVWLGTILAFFEGLDVGGNVVRTAMSRLTNDDWLARSRVGRNSFYRLSPKGEVTFTAAARQIYALHPPRWTGEIDLLLLASGGDRESARAALQAANYGGFAPDIWFAPSCSELPEAPAGTIRLAARVDRSDAAQLAARAWPLDVIAGRYRQLADLFLPLRAVLQGDGELAPADAIMARVLLIHEYRRILLRDPILPAEMLPPDWPGTAARALVGSLYRALLPASEAWLDQHTGDGAQTPAGPTLRARFVDPSPN